MLFKKSVRTSKKTPHFAVTKINWLTLFKEIIAVYSENHTKQIEKDFLLIIEASETLVFKGLKTCMKISVLAERSEFAKKNSAR
jgi:hypothetical protein